MLVRQKLLEEMKALRAQAARYPDSASLLKEARLPGTVVDARLTDLINAVAESVPEQAKVPRAGRLSPFFPTLHEGERPSAARG
jgi:hypothetical protein